MNAAAYFIFCNPIPSASVVSIKTSEESQLAYFKSSLFV